MNDYEFAAGIEAWKYLVSKILLYTLLAATGGAVFSGLPWWACLIGGAAAGAVGHKHDRYLRRCTGLHISAELTRLNKSLTEVPPVDKKGDTHV